MIRSFFILVLAIFVGVVTAQDSDPYMEDDYCPVYTCACSIQGGEGATMDCTGNEYITLEALITVYIMGGEKSHSFFENLRSVTFEPKAVRVLPDYDTFLERFTSIKFIFLGPARMENCTEVEVYREQGVVIQSEACPDEGPTAAPDTKSALAPDYKDYHTDALPVQSLSAPDHATSAPSTLESPKTSEADVAWTVIFLNCCFVGLSGMILGALLALILPPLFTKVIKRLRRQRNRHIVADLEFQAKFRPLLQSHTESQSSTSGSMPRSHPGSVKRTTV